MSLSCIKPITAISGSISFCRKIMQKHQTGSKNTSRFPTMIFFKKKGYFFPKKIINRNRKWNKLAVSYPFLVYNITSSSARVFEKQINFFLSFHLQKQNVKFFNIFLNHLDLALIQLKTSLYQFKTELTTKNLKKTFLLSITESKNLSIDKINNTNNVIEVLQNMSEVLETTYIPKKTCFLKSLLPESRFLRPISDSRISWIESTIINKIERIVNNIKNLNLLFTLKFSYNLSTSQVNGYLKNRKLLEKVYIRKKLVPLSRVSIIRSRNTLKVIEALSSRKSLKDQYLLNDADNLNSSIFSTDIDYWSNSSFLSTMFQPRDTFFSKTSSRIYSLNFAEKLLRMDFSADKKMTELKTVSSGHNFTPNPKQLKVNLIKNSGLSFTLKSPESLPDQVISELPNSRHFLENSFHPTNNIFLKEQSFFKNIITLKFLNLSAIRNNLHNKYFFNHFFNKEDNLNSSFFSTIIYPLNNSNFLNRALQLHYTFFSKASRRIYSQNFAEKLLRLNLFDDKKMTEFEKESNSHSSSHSSNQKINLLEENRIKNSILLFTLKLPESLPDQMVSKLLGSKIFLKSPRYLKDSVFLSNERFLKSIILLKTLDSSAIMNDFYRIYFLNHFFNQDSTSNNSFFSTGIYHHNNLNFFGRATQLRYTFFSKTSKHISSQNLTEKPLRMDFSADKKILEFKVTDNKRNFAQGSKLMKIHKSENYSPEFERMTTFSPHVVDLSLNNLTLSGRKTQFSTLIKQTPAIAKRNPIFSLSHLELRNKRVVPIFKKKIMFFASGNEIPGLDYGKNHNFQKNGENLIFRAQSDMERKIEEKIEQKVRKNIEQIKKASTEAIEAIVQQSRSDNSGIRERQKQNLDINFISDQVLRLMEHRLIIERERRGIL